MEIITSENRHAAAIPAILNEAIVTATPLYDNQPRVSVSPAAAACGGRVSISAAGRTSGSIN